MKMDENNNQDISNIARLMTKGTPEERKEAARMLNAHKHNKNKEVIDEKED